MGDLLTGRSATQDEAKPIWFVLVLINRTKKKICLVISSDPADRIKGNHAETLTYWDFRADAITIDMPESRLTRTQAEVRSGVYEGALRDRFEGYEVVT